MPGPQRSRPGKHVVVIRVLGQNGPGSTGLFVDLDGFRVEKCRDRQIR
jgi:hypothetical protein